MSIQIKSFLNNFIQKVNNCCKDNLNNIKDEMVKDITESKIKDEDKKLLIKNIQIQPSPYKLQQYFYNALLKYEGFGLNQLK